MQVVSIGINRLGIDDAGTVRLVEDGEVVDLPEWRAQMFIRGGLVRAVDDGTAEASAPATASAPDFAFADGLDKDDLAEYAASFGVKLDKRKPLATMLEAFKGAF